jgi:hypothetical protein
MKGRRNIHAERGIILVLLFGVTQLWALSSTDSVKINEIYYAGSMGFTMEDQYVELYNAGSTVTYLDGALIMRGQDTLATRVFRFPGWHGEQNHPIYPGQYIVIAQDAINFIEGDNWQSGDIYSVDLSHADYEAYDSWEWPNRDDPDIPNLVEALGIHLDMEFDHYHGQVILATGASLEIFPWGG